jgi:hypothetical protein
VIRSLLAVTLVAAAILPTAPGVRAEDAPGFDHPQEVDWATFAYVEPAPVYRLRLGLELLGLVSIATIGYIVAETPSSLPGGPTVFRPWQKLTFQPGTWVFEPDSFWTNMGGHGSSGTLYYLVARGNRVSIPEAFLWTVGASLAWELAEYREPVSINDMIITPVGGLAIGEAFTQLSAWFDRSGDDSLSKALAFIFNPARKIHDWIDGAVPDRDPRALGWHEFQAFGGGGFVSQSTSGVYPLAALGVASRLFRAPGYGKPGRDRFTFKDGNASRIGLGVTFAGNKVLDFLFDTETALAGAYFREIGGTDEAPSGWDLLVAGTVGYEFGSHCWNLRMGDVNRIALVRFPGLSLKGRIFAGRTSVSMGLDGALVFGGVQPFALQQSTGFPRDEYYYAIGLRFAPSLEVRHGSAAVGASMWLDMLYGVNGGAVVATSGQMADLTDQRSLASIWARWRVPDPSIEFALAFQWRARSGSADAVRASEKERSVVGSLGVVF